MLKNRKPLTPEEVAEILRRNGELVTIQEAKSILEFLKNLAKLALEQYFER
ncbi:hypothetical protein GCM10027037_00260 [Mucilaginibacter koreensis]